MTATGPQNGVHVRNQANDDDEINLKDIFAQLLAQKPLILFFTIIAAVIGAFFAQIPPTIYKSNSVVQIEQRSDKMMLPEELIGSLLTGTSSGSTSLGTEIHIIRSRLVLGPVVEELKERTVIEPRTAPIIGDLIYRRPVPYLQDFLPPQFGRFGETVDVSFIDLPESQTGRIFELHVTGPAAYKLILPDGTGLVGAVQKPLSLPFGGAFLVTSINAPSGRIYTVKRESLRDSVARLAKGLSINERGAGGRQSGSTGIVDFSYRGEDGEKAVTIVNAVVKEYINQNLLKSAEQIDRSLGFIENQMSQALAEAKAANEALAAFRQDKQVSELSNSTQELLNAALETEAQLEELMFRKDQLLLVLTVNHPDVQQLELEEKRLRERLADISEDLTSIPEVEQELARIVRRVESAQMLEQQLTARAEQLRILRAGTVSNIRVLDYAEVAWFDGPDRRRPIVIAALLGLMLGVGLVLLRNSLRRGIEDTRDIEAMGIPLFATIQKSALLVNKTARSKEYGLALFDPTDMAVESLRGLRTGLKFALASSNSKSMMITSCAPGDGKSFIALNLALLYGQVGAKVLLVDADMRRGFIRRYFGMDAKQPGLSDFLSGSAENCICHFEDMHIDVLFSGRFPPNPAELLESNLFSEFLEDAERHYDLVIIDAPPALAVSDPAIIGQKVGISMLVVRHLNTTTADIEAAQKALGTAGVKLSGVILNQYDESKSRYGTRYNYGYGGYRYAYMSEKPKD